MAEASVFETRKLSVGYRGKALIRGIDIRLERGQILALIGPNGAGKSTILKTVTGQLPAISGTTLIEGRELEKWSRGELAKKLTVEAEKFTASAKEKIEQAGGTAKEV